MNKIAHKLQRVLRKITAAMPTFTQQDARRLSKLLATRFGINLCIDNANHMATIIWKPGVNRESVKDVVMDFMDDFNVAMHAVSTRNPNEVNVLSIPFVVVRNANNIIDLFEVAKCCDSIKHLAVELCTYASQEQQQQLAVLADRVEACNVNDSQCALFFANACFAFFKPTLEEQIPTHGLSQLRTINSSSQKLLTAAAQLFVGNFNSNDSQLNEKVNNFLYDLEEAIQGGNLKGIPVITTLIDMIDTKAQLVDHVKGHQQLLEESVAFGIAILTTLLE